MRFRSSRAPRRHAPRAIGPGDRAMAGRIFASPAQDPYSEFIPNADRRAIFREPSALRARRPVMKELTRYFAARGIILPDGAVACFSTPIGDAEIDLIG